MEQVEGYAGAQKKYYYLYNMARHMSCTMWSEVRMNRVEDMDSSVMFMELCDFMRVEVMKSTIK